MNFGSKEAMAAAAVVRECRRALAAAGSTIVREATGGADLASEWRHYPDGEAYDPQSHAQYFFHRHDEVAHASEGRREAGHFHLFLRAEGMPAGTMPLLLPELAVANVPVPPQAAPLKLGARDEVCHLIAIAVDAAGEPVRLFTTNRWVTGETWYAAADVIAMLGRFRVAGPRPSPLLNQWLGALLRLYRPEIAELLRERDATVMGWRRRRRTNVFEDPRLEIASALDIDLEAKLAALERFAAPPPAAVTMPPPSRLPRMAEGWGV